MKKLAYIISAHKYGNQLKVLLDELLKYDFIRIAIHLDINSSDDVKKIVKLYSKKNENIDVIEPIRILNFSWAIMQNILNSIEFLTKYDDWSHVVHCSGQCLPLIKQDTLFNKLEDDTSYIEYCDAKEIWWKTISNRINNIWGHDPVTNTYYNLGDRPNIPYDNIYAGPDWFVLSRKAAKFLISNNIAKDRAFFTTTLVPAEIFPHTMLINNGFKVKSANYWYRVFEEGQSHPKTFKIEDIQHICHAKYNGCWFIRKFNYDDDKEIVKKTLELLNSKTYMDIFGFHHYPEFYKQIFDTLKDGDVFIELGTFLGKSIIHMAQMVIASKKDVKLYAIDNFSGAIIEEYKSKLEGMTAYDACVKNLKDCNVYDMVNLINMDTREAHNKFDDECATHIYVDAGHSYDDVTNDIKNWLPKLKKGGTMSGDDYDFQTVAKAVNDYFGEGNFETKYNKWIYRK